MDELAAPASSAINLKTSQLRAILEATSRTVASLCSASDECMTRLDGIEDQIEATSDIDGVRVLRFRLEECLQALRDEARHQREEMAQFLAKLQRQVGTAETGEAERGPVGLEPGVDKVSGLEEREGAEQAIVAAMERGGLAYAALFVVDRLHLINAQFGYATGDRILREFCEHLRSSFLPEDRLFRWTGPAFLAVVERGDEPAEVEADIQRIAGSRLEAAVQIGNGCVRLPIVRTALLLPLAGTLAELTSRMDAFTGQQARH
jgi:PleD family two-component response regulator